MLTNICLVAAMILLAFIELRPSSKETTRLSRKEMVVMSLGFLTCTFAFFWLTGLFTSGYHLTDDHEVYSFGRKISTYGFVQALKDVLLTDLETRYRPVYFIIRMLQIRILGDNFLAWHIMYAIISVSNICLAYYYARYRGSRMFSAFAFATTIFIGCTQSQVLWRLGPQENLSVLFLMILLIVLRRYYETGSKYCLTSSIVLAVILSLSKESFFVLVPTFPLMLLYWHVLDSDSVSKENLFGWMKRHTVFFYSVLLILLVGISMILIFVRTGSSGVGDGSGIMAYIKGFWNIYRGEINIYVRIAAVAAIISLIEVILGSHSVGERIAYAVLLILVVGNVGIQFFLHAKMGMEERYLIPTTAIIALLVFVAVPVYYSRAAKISKWYYYVYMLLSGYTLFMNMPDQFYAREFARNGRDITKCLERIAEISTKETIVLADMDYEEDASASIYLQEKYGINHTYNVSNSDSSDGRYHDYYHPESSLDSSISLDEAEIILVYKDGNDVIKDSNRTSAYDMETFGDFCIYRRL